MFRWILAEIEKTETGYITQRHAQQYGHIREAKAFSEAIKFLADHNLIEVIKEGKSTHIKPKPIKLGEDE